MGGTALAVHLGHRISRDLDVFTFDEFDPVVVARRLGSMGSFAVTLQDRGTLNGVFDDVKVQFLWASGQTQLEEPKSVANLAVGSMPDLLATKVKVIGDRGELRDYFDLKVIEELTERTFEQGIALYLARFGLDADSPTVKHIVRALGHFDSVETDPFLEREIGSHLFDEVRTYWQRRQVEVMAHLDRSAGLK